MLSSNISVKPGKGKANIRPGMGKDCSVVMYHGMGSMGYENVSFTKEENNEVWHGQRSKWVNPEEKFSSEMGGSNAGVFVGGHLNMS